MKSRACLVLLVIFGLHQNICGQVQSGSQQLPYPYTQPIQPLNYGAPMFPYFRPQPYYGLNPMYMPPQPGYYPPMPYPYPYPNLPYPYFNPSPQQPYMIPQQTFTNNQQNLTNNIGNFNPNLYTVANNPSSQTIPNASVKLDKNPDNRSSYLPEEVYEEYDFDGKLISAQTEFKPPVWTKNSTTVMQYRFPQPIIDNISNDFSRNNQVERKTIKYPTYSWYGKNTTIYQPEPIRGTSNVQGNSTTTIIANTVIKPNQKPVTTVQIFRDKNQNRPNVTVVNPEQNEVFVDTGLSTKNVLHSTTYNSRTTIKPATTTKPLLAYGNGYSPTRWTTTSIPWYLRGTVASTNSRQTPTPVTTPMSTTPLHLTLFSSNNNDDNVEEDYKDDDDDNSEEIEEKLFPTFPETTETTTERKWWFGK